MSAVWPSPVTAHPGTRERMRTPRYESAARRIAYTASLGAIAQVGLAVSAGYAAGLALAFAAGIEGMAPGLALSMLFGGFVAHRVSRRMSRIIGAAVARPIEMIVTHLAASGDDVVDAFRAPKGRRLDAGALLADEAFLRSRFALAEERARDLVIQLEEARAQADLQNVAKSQFMAGMSHELRTPLNAILGYALLLQEDATATGNVGAAADLDRIALAGRQLLMMINNVLDLSRLETGGIKLNRTAIDLKALLASVSAEVAGDLARHGGSLVTVPSDEVRILLSDRPKVVICLQNLVNYAAGAAPGREIGLEVAQTAGSATVSFSVWAMGVDSLTTASIEDVDAAGHSVRALEPRALGLQIARQLARLLGGDVDIVHGADVYSKLRLSLPLNVAIGVDREVERSVRSEEQATVADSASLADAPDGALDGDTPRRALVIDDNPGSLDLMRRWLGKLGYAVAIAADAEHGLALAGARQFDIIMLDVFMPGYSGYDVLEKLRAATISRETPVIMYTVDDDRGRALDAGASDHVRKPVSEDQLRGLLRIYREPATSDLLIIDADDESAEFMRRCAKQAGFTTRRASDSADALALARASRPDIILFDLSTSCGVELPRLQALLADDAFAGVPVVVVSSNEIPLAAHRFIDAAGCRFMPKGVHFPREIGSKLQEMVA